MKASTIISDYKNLPNKKRSHNKEREGRINKRRSIRYEGRRESREFRYIT